MPSFFDTSTPIDKNAYRSTVYLGEKDEVLDQWTSSDTARHGSPEEFYTDQVNKLLSVCVSEHNVPFFRQGDKPVPNNLLNGTVMKDINKAAAELHATATGCKKTDYIFGHEARSLGLTLDVSKNTTPLLVCNDTKFASRSPLLNEIKVADAGTKTGFQYMYNVEQFDDRSRKLLHKILPERKTFESEQVQSHAQSQKNFLDNTRNPAIKEAMRLENAKRKDELSAVGLLNVYKVIQTHNIVQQHGSYDLVGGVPSFDADARMSALFSMEVQNTLKKIDKGTLPKQALLYSMYQGQDFSNRAVMPQFSYETKHQMDEKLKKEKNIHLSVAPSVSISR